MGEAETFGALLRRHRLRAGLTQEGLAERTDDRLTEIAERPKLVMGLLRGLWLIFANLLVFVPKRTVTITLEAFATANRPAANREAINPWMEAWYNADVSPEPATFVPHHFLFGPRTWEFPPPPSQS